MSKTLVILLLLSITSMVTYTAGQAQQCKAGEEWEKRGDKEGCFCKNPYKIYDLKLFKPDLTCEAFKMLATFHKCQFKDLSIYFNETHVQKKICYNYDDDDAKNWFTIEVPIYAGSCTAEFYETNQTHVTYKANFIIDMTDLNAVITRTKPLNVTLRCSYELNMLTTLQKTLKPFISSIYITVDGVGKFEVYMTLFKNSDYTNPYTGSELTINTDDYLYVGVYVFGGDHSTLLLVMKDCYATPEKDEPYSKKYYMIQNGCPNKADGTVAVKENGVSREGKFSVQMFKFVGNYDSVHLHCAVSLCDTKKVKSCVPNCPARRRRSDDSETPGSYDAPAAMTLGPIKRSGEAEPLPPTTPKAEPLPPTTAKPAPPTSPKSGSSIVTSSHIFWTLLIPALTILKQFA